MHLEYGCFEKQVLSHGPRCKIFVDSLPRLAANCATIQHYYINPSLPRNRETRIIY